MSWTTLISTRMLKGKKRRGLFSPMSLIAICGIAFGVTATLVSLSVVTGFQKAYQSAILDFNAHIVLIQEEEIESFSKEAKEVLSSFKEIKGMTPFIFREGLGVFPDGVSGVVLKGVDPETLREVYPLSYQKVSKKDLEWDGQGVPPVIVGVKIFDRLSLEEKEGKKPIKLLMPKGETLTKKAHLSDYAQEFRVVGNFESGLYDFDSQFILTSLFVARKIFNLDHSLTGIELRLDDPRKAPALARMIEEALPLEFQAISWDELNEPLFYAMKMEKVVFIMIMLLILLIASFNVMGSILMMILNRRGDIAILRAMGVQKKSLYHSFALQGVILGGVGLLIGFIASAMLLLSLQKYHWLSLDPQVYFISHLPVSWPFALWIGLGIVVLMICYLVSNLAAKMVVRYGSLIQTFR